jgi:glucose-6-phosphate dehydrogenase assembly protein OpcA
VPAIAPERILRDLADLWASLAHPEQGDVSSQGVLRACSMTLIVAAENAADAVRASETLAALMHEHPSRAIVLQPGPPGSEMDAHVRAQCWMPFGSRQQICCEQIEITAGIDRLNDIPPVMYGLLAPDLPSVLWSRGTAWWDAPAFVELVNMMGKLILDSRRYEGSSGLARIRSLRDRGKRVGDLAWASVTPWRELIAHALETSPTLDDVRLICVRGRDGESIVPAAYIGAWLKRAFGGATVQIERDGPGAGEVSRVMLSGGGWEILFRRTESQAVDVTRGGAARMALLAPMDERSAMREELSITGDDPVFEEVFPIAQELAQAA